MPLKPSSKASQSPITLRKKHKLSQKRLDALIYNQNTDSDLQNSDQTTFDISDLRTAKEKEELLLWVHLY
jgi:hypothetical protein